LLVVARPSKSFGRGCWLLVQGAAAIF
jgi:hypothetical protein